MWKWSLNWDEITSQILIGSCPMRPTDLDRVRNEARATAVMSLQHDECLAYWNIDAVQMQTKASVLGLTFARCPIRDFDISDMQRQLPRAVALLASLQLDRNRTYVHCTAGMGRSPLVVLGYLTWVDGLHPEEAIALILKGRPAAVPAWEAYLGCRVELVAGHREAIVQRAFELYQRGVHKNADADWHQAESEILREVLTRQNRS